MQESKVPRLGDAQPAESSGVAALLPDRVTSLADFAVERVLNEGGENGSLNGASRRGSAHSRHSAQLTCWLQCWAASATSPRSSR